MKIIPKVSNIIVIETNDGKAYEIAEYIDRLVMREVDIFTHNHLR
jgi:arginine repressor